MLIERSTAVCFMEVSTKIFVSIGVNELQIYRNEEKPSNNSTAS